jgi:hypothetical protein
MATRHGHGRIGEVDLQADSAQTVAQAVWRFRCFVAVLEHGSEEGEDEGGPAKSNHLIGQDSLLL